MTFVRYKKFGNLEYAYEITAYWDKKKKKPRQKVKYLGKVINKEKKVFEKKQHRTPEKLILDFGDSYLVNKLLQDNGYYGLLSSVFEDYCDTLFALIAFRLCQNSAMRHAQAWFNGNYAKIIYKKAEMPSQRISDFLKILGEEEIQRAFFKKYLPEFSNARNGIIIDATSLPNQIHNPLTAWGRSGEEIDMQMRFLLVVDKEKSSPLFFRCLPGNIVDVSTLSNTIDELKKYGIKNTCVYADAGFFSEDNITELYKNQIDFMMRLPAGRTIFKELMETELTGLESGRNMVRYGKRGLFIKQRKISIFGGHEAYAHVVLDPQRKGRETSRLVTDVIEDKTLSDEEIDYQIQTSGIMVVISSFNLSKEEVVPAYYVRQTAEVLFGFSKDDLDILPLRVHDEQAIRGFLFLQFITLIAFTQLKKKFGKECTVEEALINMRNLKCKVYDDEILIGELTKQQKMITKNVDVIVPKTLGI